MRNLRSRLNGWQTRVAAQLARRTPSENAFLFLLPVVGVVVGLTSVGVAHVLAFLQNHIWGSGTSLLEAAQSIQPRWWCIIIPLVGGIIVGAIGWGLRIETRGAGTGRLIQAITLKGGVISLGETLRWLSAALVTLATGGSLGREGPMMRLSAALGSKLGRVCRLRSEGVV